MKEFKMTLAELKNDERLNSLQKFTIEQIVSGNYWLVGDYRRAYFCLNPELIKREAFDYINNHCSSEEFIENYSDFEFDGQTFGDYQEFIYGDENEVVSGFFGEDDERLYIYVKINGGKKAVAI